MILMLATQNLSTLRSKMKLTLKLVIFNVSYLNLISFDVHGII